MKRERIQSHLRKPLKHRRDSGSGLRTGPRCAQAEMAVYAETQMPAVGSAYVETLRIGKASRIGIGGPMQSTIFISVFEVRNTRS
jgi:hypothetical protein